MAQQLVEGTESVVIEKIIEIRKQLAASGLEQMAGQKNGLTMAVAKKLSWIGVTFDMFFDWVKEGNAEELQKVFSECKVTGSTRTKNLEMFDEMVKVYGPRRLEQDILDSAEDFEDFDEFEPD